MASSPHLCHKHERALLSREMKDAHSRNFMLKCASFAVHAGLHPLLFSYRNARDRRESLGFHCECDTQGGEYRQYDDSKIRLIPL